MTRLHLLPEDLPDGRYALRIVTVRVATSLTGHPTLYLTVEVVAGPHAGYALPCCYSLVPQARWKLRRLLHATHVHGPPNELDTADLLLRQLAATVRRRPLAVGAAAYDIDDETPVTPQP